MKIKLSCALGCLLLSASQCNWAMQDLGNFNALTHTNPIAATTNHVHGKDCLHKPGAEIAIVSREFVSLNPGEIKDFNIDLASTDVSGNLQVDLQAGKGLQLLSGQQHFNFDLANAQTVTLPVQLRAATEGSLVLNVMATITNDQGQKSSRAMALIVQVGNTMNNNGQQKGQVTAAVDGEAVVVLPAAEVIH